MYSKRQKRHFSIHLSIQKFTAFVKDIGVVIFLHLPSLSRMTFLEMLQPNQSEIRDIRQGYRVRKTEMTLNK